MGSDPRPTRWGLSIAEQPSAGDSNPRGYRSVGNAETSSSRGPDGDVELTSLVRFDSSRLLRARRSPPERRSPGPTIDDHVEVRNVCKIDPSGNLSHFRAEVRVEGEQGPPMLTLDGRIVGKTLEVTAKGPIPLLNWTRRFPYESRGLIQNAVGPTDRLPGLQVGQRWETRVVSPLTGRVETVRTEVTGRHFITWDNVPVSTLVVVQHLAPVSARTWVRPDGLVLKQEIPFPFVKLILERVPTPDDRPLGGKKAP